MFRIIGVDGRSAENRRFADLMQGFVAELGGKEKLSEFEWQRARQAATLIIRQEQLQLAVMRGEHVDDEQLSRSANVINRILKDLGIRRRAKDKPRTLAEVMRGAA